MTRNNVFNLQGLEMFSIADFLSAEECAVLCTQIEKENQRSMVVVKSSSGKGFSEGRTSQSAFFKPGIPEVKKVEKRIANELGIALEFAEPIQGQLYNEGEFFNDHHDYFSKESFQKFHKASGQRTWTAMIYLNDVEAGGHTEFPLLGKSFAPLKGSAIFWKNSNGKGSENPASLHSGRPVIKGQKVILTKWFRERKYLPLEDLKLSEEQESKKVTIALPNKRRINVEIDYVNGLPHARYGNKNNIPAFTKKGFKKTKIPAGLYQSIMDFYRNEKGKSRPEFDPKNKNNSLGAYIWSEDVDYPTEMVPLNQETIKLIFDQIQPLVSAWADGRTLERTHCYGIRTYFRGAVLKKHTDGFETRILSAILNIDQKVDEPWALQIDNHQGKEQEVFLKAGEMVFYESAILEHGRIKPFQGDYFTNLFVHFVNLD